MRIFFFSFFLLVYGVILPEVIDKVGNVTDTKSNEQKNTKRLSKATDTKPDGSPIPDGGAAEDDVSKTFGCVVVVTDGNHKVYLNGHQQEITATIEREIFAMIRSISFGLPTTNFSKKICKQDSAILHTFFDCPNEEEALNRYVDDIFANLPKTPGGKSFEYRRKEQMKKLAENRNGKTTTKAYISPFSAQALTAYVCILAISIAGSMAAVWWYRRAMLEHSDWRLKCQLHQQTAHSIGVCANEKRTRVLEGIEHEMEKDGSGRH